VQVENVMFNRRLASFSRLVHATYRLPGSVLLSIVMARGQYPATYRAAALRHLIARAPVSVTRGLPFAQRRRLVRLHYGI
jgi:hypothetical protein